MTGKNWKWWILTENYQFRLADVPDIKNLKMSLIGTGGSAFRSILWLCGALKNGRKFLSDTTLAFSAYLHENQKSKNRLSGIATIYPSYISEILARTAGDLLNVEGQGVHFSENVFIKHIFHNFRNHIHFHIWSKPKWFPDFSYLKRLSIGPINGWFQEGFRATISYLWNLLI